MLCPVDLGIEDGAEERLMNILEEERLESGTLTYNQLTDFDWGGLYPDDTAKANWELMVTISISMNKVDNKYSSKY